RRVSTSFRRVAIDRFRGDGAVRRRLDQLVFAHASESLIQATEAQKGKVIWVSVSDEDEPGDKIEFLLRPDEGIFIAHSSETDRIRFRPLAKKLADLLGYQLGKWTTFLEVNLAYKYFPGIAEELTLNRIIVDAIQDNNIGLIDEFKFTSEGIKLTVTVADEEMGRKRVAAVLQELFPDVSLTINVPPHEIPWYP